MHSGAAGVVKGPRVFKEDISIYAEPPRPPRKARLWVFTVFVVLTGLAIAHAAGLTKPLTTLALQLTGGGAHLPGWRLVGDWESDDDPTFRRVCHLAHKEGYRGTGIYMADDGRGMREVMFRITREDHAGCLVQIAEYYPEKDANYWVLYRIAKDGKSMTREYYAPDRTPVFCHYRYLGPPTQDPPRRFRFLP